MRPECVTVWMKKMEQKESDIKKAERAISDLSWALAKSSCDALPSVPLSAQVGFKLFFFFSEGPTFSPPKGSQMIRLDLFNYSAAKIHSTMFDIPKITGYSHFEFAKERLEGTLSSETAFLSDGVIIQQCPLLLPFLPSTYCKLTK